MFTPRGERDWVPGWDPQFPAAAADDTEPGTVFQTQAREQSATWVVVEREQGRRISYTRVVPGVEAGTVTVELTNAGGHTEVSVGYETAALSEPARLRLSEFAEQCPAFLQSWHDPTAMTPPPGRSGGRRSSLPNTVSGVYDTDRGDWERPCASTPHGARS